MGCLAVLICLALAFSAAAQNANRIVFSDPSFSTFLATLEKYESTQNEVVFLLDESGSIGKERYSQVKLFTKLTVRRLLVSAQHSRVAIVSFSDYTREHANYIRNSQGNNMCTLINVINNLDYIGQGTMTGLAMENARQIFAQSRPGSNKIIVLITDGQSNSNSSPVEIAKDLRRRGVIIFAVGVADVNVKEMKDVATSQNHIYILKDFSFIEKINEQLTKSINDLNWDLVKDKSLCNDFCDSKTDCCDINASCNCGIQSGSHQCACNAGYQGTGHRNGCHKCRKGTYKSTVGNVDCTPCPLHSTTSTDGAVSPDDCYCETGYEKHGLTCKAVECAKLKAPPGGILIPSNCSNLFGSECSLRCKEGYCPHSCSSANHSSALPPWNRLPLQSRYCLETAKWSGEDFHCEEMKCPVLDHPLHGKHNCSSSNFVFGTTCSFTCENGYVLSGSSNRECLVSGAWTGSETICEEIYCDPLKSNTNLQVKPSYCTKKNMKLNSICQYHCVKGYSLTSQYGVNDGINKCLANKTWSGVNYELSCKDISPPVLKCPDSVITTTDPSKSTAFVAWDEPIVEDNVFVSGTRIKEPSYINKPQYAFPIGTTKVVYEAYDSSGLSNTCSFSVTVADKEPPIVLYCPENIEEYHENKKPIRIKWKEPKFIDNSGRWNVSKSNRENGGLFSWGTPSLVIYDASDPSGNRASCNFTIKVRQYPCPDIKAPENGFVSCDTWQDGVLCSVFCMEHYEFASTKKVPSVFRCGRGRVKNKREWTPFQFDQRTNFNVSTDLPDCTRITKRSALNTSVEMSFPVDSCSKESLEKMKKRFIHNLMLEENKYQSGLICPVLKGCKPENVNITCVSPPSKVKRSVDSATDKKSILVISFNVETYPNTTEILSESLNNDSILAQSNLFIKEIEDQVSKDVRDVYKMSSLPAPQVKYDVALICSVGQIMKNGSCVNCPAGTYKDDISGNCVDCPTATFQDKERSLMCLPCPKYHATYQTRSKSRDDCKAPCQPGTFARSTFEPCDPCPLNTYQENPYGKECLKCPAGTFTWGFASNSSSDCSKPCNPGSYSDTGLEPCSLCDYGFYQNSSQQQSCEPCSGNTTTDVKGSKDSSNCKEMNLCEDQSPCSGATCVPIQNTYKCICPYGRYGERCELYVDLCELDTCSNNGTCHSSLGSYKCLCPDGFSGKLCDIDIDDCEKGYCLNNGKCVDLVNDYVCVCAPGFMGSHCEININDCKPNSCLNGGICFDKVQGHRCCCPTGYTGDNCEIELDLCANVLCKNDGVCESTGTNTSCKCKKGFTGDHCEINIDDCTDYDCLNNGTCLDGINKAVCNCPLMFSGSHCEEDATPEYALTFTAPITSNYVQLKNTKLLYAITISLYMRTTYKKPDSHPTPVSYSYYDEDNKLLVDNALTIFDTNGIVLYLHGKGIHTEYTANGDSDWHHYAVTWESNKGKWAFYVDGKAYISGLNVGLSKYFYPGMFILGQEQDSLGAGFSTTEAFVGDITEFNVWDYAMPEEEIKSISHHCRVVGNVIPWIKAMEHINGAITVSKDVDICKELDPCSSDNCYCLYSSRLTDHVCKHSVQDCNPNPCENNQQCSVQDSKSFCNCTKGYDGKLCELDVNECLLDNGNCTHICYNTIGSYECKCPGGMMLADDGLTCKDVNYCQVEGRVHLDGETWFSDCENCSCTEGVVSCHREVCEALECSDDKDLILLPGNCCPRCVSYEFNYLSPGILTRPSNLIDHSNINLSAECTHTLVEDCINGLYSVQYEASKNDSSMSTLVVYDSCMKLQLSHNGTIFVEGELVPVPYENKIFNIKSDNETIDIYSKSGLNVYWQSWSDIKIGVPAETAQYICGLCGNYQVYKESSDGKRKHTDEYSEKCFIIQESLTEIPQSSKAHRISLQVANFSIKFMSILTTLHLLQFYFSH